MWYGFVTLESGLALFCSIDQLKCLISICLVLILLPSWYDVALYHSRRNFFFVGVSFTRSALCVYAEEHMLQSSICLDFDLFLI
jgi:hypothetical protein